MMSKELDKLKEIKKSIKNDDFKKVIDKKIKLLEENERVNKGFSN